MTSKRGFAGMTPEKRIAIARLGGKASPGKFKTETAVTAGRKGGKASTGNFAFSRERAAKAGSKGGKASRRGKGFCKCNYPVPVGTDRCEECGKMVESPL